MHSAHGGIQGHGNRRSVTIDYMKNPLKSWLVLLLCGFLFQSTFAQDVPKFEGTNPNAPEVAFSMTIDKYAKDLSVGDVVTVCFKGTILVDGWHLYSSSKKGNISYNATELLFFEEDSKGAVVSGNMTENKKPHEYEDELMGGTIRDFKEKEVTFCQKIKITDKDVDVEGELAAQICVAPEKGGMCKFLNLPFTWKFTAKEAANGAVEEGNAGDKVDPVEENGNGDKVEGNEGNEGDGENVEGNAGNENGSGGDSESGTANAGASETATTAGAGGVFDLSKAGDVVINYEPIAGAQEEKGCEPSDIWTIFLIAFGAGLISLFTPCVFPMIPLTVSYFVKQNEGDDTNARAKGIRNGFMYSMSIILIYTVLGLVITAIFGPTALYDFASNPWANFAFFAIFFIFSLSFFGLFDLTLPSSFSTKISTKAGTGGLIGIFFMALTLVIVSFSCTGPILGSLAVGVANSDCFWAPVAGFFGFGLSFGIPFGLLALFPSAMKALPQSGGWLNSVKVVLGFLELAMCMKFLSNADLIWHWKFLNREVFIGIWIVIFIMLGFYLLGKLRLPHDDKMEKIPVPRLILAIISFSFVMYLYPGMNGASLHMIEGFLPGFNDNVGVKLIPGQVSPAPSANDKVGELAGRNYVGLLGEHESKGFKMFFDLQQALYYAEYKKMPVFVDFTGHSCANCRNMENSVWPVARVKKIMKNEVVMVALFADERNRLAEPMITPDGRKLRRISDFVKEYQEKKFHTIAQPYYVLLDPLMQNDPDPKKHILADPIGYSSEEDFYNMLVTGVKEFKDRHGLE